MHFNFIKALLIFGILLTYSHGDVNETAIEKMKLDRKIKVLLLENDALKKDLLDNNIWSKIYSNYHTYKELKKQQLLLNAKISSLESKKKLTPKERVITR